MNKISKHIQKHNLTVIIFIAFAIRFSYAIIMYVNKSYTNLADDFAYLDYARNILKQGIWVPDIGQFEKFASTVIGPGIGWIGAIIIWIFGESWLAIFMVSTIVSVLITFMIYKLGLLLFNRTVATMAAFWSVFYVSFIRYVPRFGKDLWMTLLLLLITYFIFLNRDIKKISFYDFLLGFLFFFSIHLDERFIIFGPVIILIYIFFNKFSKRTGFYKSLIFIGFALLLSLPWLVRNHKVYNRIIVISTRTNRFTEKIFNYEPKQYLNDYSKWFYLSKTQIDSIKFDKYTPSSDGNLYLQSSIADTLLTGGKMPTIVIPQQVDAIKRGIEPYWFSFWETKWKNFINFWQPIDICYSYYGNGFRFDGKWSKKHNLTSFFSYGILLPFFLYGLFICLKNKRTTGVVFFLIISSYMLLHILFIDFTTQRYRIILDPYIIILSMYAIKDIYYRVIKDDISYENY